MNSKYLHNIKQGIYLTSLIQTIFVSLIVVSKNMGLHCIPSVCIISLPNNYELDIQINNCSVQKYMNPCNNTSNNDD